MDINTILHESKQSSLTIFDIDDTLFKTTTQIHVIRGGKRTKSLTPAEFNVYKVKSGESLDFSDFRSSKVFSDSARPITNVFKVAKSIVNRFSGFANKKTVIVTARGDLDDKQLFLDTFKKYGFDVDKTHIHRAGNLGDGSSAENKKIVVRKLLSDAKYNQARIFDDDIKNIQKFLELKSEFPETAFEAFYIDHSGNIHRFKEES